MQLNSKWEIEVYTTEQGQSPFRDWLSRLDVSAQARVLERLNRLRDGNFGDHKHLQKGIYELRLHFGSGYRIYYGLLNNRIVLLLTGGNKGSQAKDIRNAQIFWDDFKESES